MAKKTTAIEKVTGKVEMVVDRRLDVANGAFIQESVNAIQNPTMKKAVQAYVKAVNNGHKSMWDVAKACAKMKLDTRKEFGSDERLADFLGFKSKGDFNRVRRTGELACRLEPLGITESNAHELLPLTNIDKETGRPKHYTMTLDEFLEDTGDTLSTLTQKELREQIKALRKQEDATEEAAEEVAEETAEEVGEEVTEEVEESWVTLFSITQSEFDRLCREQKREIIKSLNELITIVNINPDNAWITVISNQR